MSKIPLILITMIFLLFIVVTDLNLLESFSVIAIYALLMFLLIRSRSIKK